MKSKRVIDRVFEAESRRSFLGKLAKGLGLALAGPTWSLKASQAGPKASGPSRFVRFDYDDEVGFVKKTLSLSSNSLLKGSLSGVFVSPKHGVVFPEDSPLLRRQQAVDDALDRDLKAALAKVGPSERHFITSFIDDLTGDEDSDREVLAELAGDRRLRALRQVLAKIRPTLRAQRNVGRQICKLEVMAWNDIVAKNLDQILIKSPKNYSETSFNMSRLRTALQAELNPKERADVEQRLCGLLNQVLIDDPDPNEAFHNLREIQKVLEAPLSSSTRKELELKLGEALRTMERLKAAKVSPKAKSNARAKADPSRGVDSPRSRFDYAGGSEDTDYAHYYESRRSF